MMTGEFLHPGDPRWAGFLTRTRHDFYHLPEYVALAAKDEGAAPAAFYAEDAGAEFLVPLLIRPIPPALGAPAGWSDCTSPYGYPTPLMTPSQERLGDFLEAFCRAAQEREIVTAFFRLHPLLPLNHEILGKFGQVMNHGQTVYVDLSKSKEEIWRQTREDHRSDIRKLLRAGFTVTLDEWSRFDEFIALYHLTMQRVGARQAYLFSQDYFDEFRAILGSHVHLCCVFSNDGELVSSGTYVEWNGIVQGHLAGNATKYFSAAPSKLMQHFMREWAKERAHTVFHLGGGVGGARDSLFEFKSGFSKERAVFFTYRMILDEPKFLRLMRCAGAPEHDAHFTDTAFFPAYRKASSS